jgi:hypothetical protein
MRAFVVSVGYRFNVKKLCARNPRGQEFRLWVAAVGGQVPRGVEHYCTSLLDE